MSDFYILKLTPKQFQYVATQLMVAETQCPPVFDDQGKADEYIRLKSQVAAIIDRATIQTDNAPWPPPGPIFLTYYAGKRAGRGDVK